MNELSLKNAIQKYLLSGKKISKNVYVGDAITSGLIEKHCNRYADGCQNERPLLIVNDKIPGTFKGYGWSGLMITDKTLYYKCVKDSFLSGLVAISDKGSLSLSEVFSLAIGHHDHAFGSAYLGHQLIVNNRVVGLLRMGGSIFFDETAIEELGAIFQSALEGQ